MSSLTRREVFARLVKRYGKKEAEHMLHERAGLREFQGNQRRSDAEAGAWEDLKAMVADDSQAALF